MADAPPQTFVGLDPISSLCTTRQPAQLLTGIMLRLLQEHFANADNLEYNGANEFESAEGMTPKLQLQGYIWNEDKTKTNIQIQPVWEYNSQDIQRRPGIYVKRNGLQPQRIAINDGQTVNSLRDKDGKIVQVRGNYHSMMILGSHTVFCVGNTGAEAEMLGAEVFEHMLMFAPIIRQDMKFHRFTVTEVAELSLLDEFDEHFVAPVVVSYAYAWAWRLQKVAPWLKTLAIDVQTA